MKQVVIFLLVSFLIISCRKQAYTQAPIPNTDAQTQRIRLVISDSFRHQGRSHWRQASTGQTVTDIQVAGAQVLATQTLASSYILAAPAAIDQLSGECVAFATNYMRSIEQYYATGAVSYSPTVNFFSPKFIYNLSKFSPDCGSGTSAGTALTVLQQTGVCLYNTMPYDGNCSDVPNSSQYAEAANYKISSYSQVISSDLVGLKTLLANNHPFLYNTSIDDAVINANGQFAADGFIWSAYSGSGGLPHAMAVIGYDDTKVCPSNGAVGCFRVINSYGPSWADNGKYWITYDWFLQAAGYYAYVINGLGTTPPANQPPIAAVCCNQTVSTGATVNLDGSGSSDPDGSIASYSWTQLSGPNSASISSSTLSVASASGLIAGTYVFNLLVTDNLGATSNASLTITVNSVESYTLSGFKQTVKRGPTTDVLNWNVQLASAPATAVIEVSYTSATSGFASLTNGNIQPSIAGGQTIGQVTNNPNKTQLRKNRYYRININSGSKVSNVVTLH